VTTLGLSRLPGETWLVALLRRAALAGVEDWAWDAYHGRIAQSVSDRVRVCGGASRGGTDMLTRLPRQRGISIKCDRGSIVTKDADGKDVHHGECGQRHFTGNTRPDINREEAARNGWRRDSLPAGGRRRKLDTCPKHAPFAKQVLADLKAKKDTRVKAKDARARARLAKKAA
jgi:hypothetical protein